MSHAPCHNCNKVKLAMSLIRFGICCDCDVELDLQQSRVIDFDYASVSIAVLVSRIVFERRPTWRRRWGCW